MLTQVNPLLASVSTFYMRFFSRTVFSLYKRAVYLLSAEGKYDLLTIYRLSKYRPA